MPTARPRAANILAAALAAAILMGCTADQPESAAAEPQQSIAVEEPSGGNASTAADTVRQPDRDTGPTAGVPPNELGEILVLEYHRLGDDEGEWYRSRDHFAEDLQKLYARGFRPVTMRQVLDGDLDLPAGTTPVVFTFDDSSKGQFYFLEDGSLDPNSMVGMWEAFREQNPAWRGGATWCVLPGAEFPSNFWSEKKSKEVPRAEREANIQKKVSFLLERGHEICNHTMWHARLDRYDDAFVQDQIGSAIDSLRAYLPESYEVVTFALPLGMWPKNRQLAWKGSYRDGRSYENQAILEVSGGPNPSPYSTEFDPRSINRFIVAPNALERQFAAYEKNPGRRYVSDGDPQVVTVPEGLGGQVDRSRTGGRSVKVVPPAGAAAGP
jgi:peptidoglycan/xylan/chitin deacetylase (PgdA/CDA1 family)